jgi:hypothetical protein
MAVRGRDSGQSDLYRCHFVDADMKRKSKKEPLQVTSFRLPLDVKAFLKKKSTEADRTMSYTLVDYLRKWQAYEDTEAKQPKIKK